MPLAAVVGSAVVTGHGCDAATAIAGPGAPSVLINGKPAATVGDLTMPHNIGVPPFCSPHTMPIASGCPTVLVNGKPLAHIGSSVDSCTITSSATTVTVCDGPVVP